jgi:glutathione S-transferase
MSYIPEVTYFNVDARGAPIRAALLYSDVAFTDTRVQGWEEWLALKPQAPFGALPIMKVDEVTYSQSLALARWAGKLSGLYPQDGLKALAVDEIMDVCQEILSGAPSDPDAAIKEAKRKEYAAGPMKNLFDRLAPRVSAPNFVAGPEFTIADLVIYFFLFQMLRGGQFDYIPADYTDAWPSLKALEERIKAHPAVEKYFAAKEKLAEKK